MEVQGHNGLSGPWIWINLIDSKFMGEVSFIKEKIGSILKIFIIGNQTNMR